jgi:hypothetical protein
MNDLATSPILKKVVSLGTTKARLAANDVVFKSADGEEKKNFPELKHANTFWTWGDYAKHSGKTPTMHGVEYFGGNGPRYSIIYNLECEYN